MECYFKRMGSPNISVILIKQACRSRQTKQGSIDIEILQKYQRCLDKKIGIDRDRDSTKVSTLSRQTKQGSIKIEILQKYQRCLNNKIGFDRDRDFAKLSTLSRQTKQGSIDIEILQKYPRCLYKNRVRSRSRFCQIINVVSTEKQGSIEIEIEILPKYQRCLDKQNRD